MKTSKRYYVILIVFLINCLPIFAQNLGDLLFGSDNQSNYIGQYNYNGKRKNGFGVERSKNGSIYIGDFSEGKISGKGLLYDNKKGITNIPGAIIYVGSFINGKKEGNGRCYDTSGTLLYNGKFVSDKPTSNNIDNKLDLEFKICEFNGVLYFGEVRNNLPNGIGLIIDEDDIITYGNLVDGEFHGVSLRIFNSKYWEVGNWDGSQFNLFANSTIATQNINDNKNVGKIRKKETWGYITEAIGNFGNATILGLEVANEVKGGDDMSTQEISNNSMAIDDSNILSKQKNSQGKCSSCGGSGTCSPSSGSNRKNACHGSKLCGHCDGTGWISAGSGRALCAICKGSKKCITCKGTGKCPKCNGSGKA